MNLMIRFLLTRILSTLITLFIITLVLYGTVMLSPPEIRAGLYLPKKIRESNPTQEELRFLTIQIVKRYHLDEPFPIQYGYWISYLLHDHWGYSPTLQDYVFDALLRRTPITAELTIYSLLMFIPLGLLSGVIAGWRQNHGPDHRFRFAAYISTSLPPFILGLVLISIFYVVLHWFPPEQLGVAGSQAIRAPGFITYTGLLTIDGLLNHQPDISLEAARHLVLPVITLSLLHWATLGRVTRAAIIEELRKDYIVAGRARGIPESRLVWRHAFPNTLVPALSSSALSAASLFTSVFVIEVIFNFKGISDLIVNGLRGAPDASAALGFSLYSVTVILIIMFVLDIIQVIADPRVREGLIKG